MEEKWRVEAEWAFAQILQNPVMFRQFINTDNENWQPLENHERAWTSSNSPYLCMCCGRRVRKTTTVIEMLFYWVVNNMFIPGDPGLLLFVPNKAQKDSIFPRIRAACEKHWLLSKLVDKNRINVAEGRIEFFNGFIFIMRIAGTEGRESNVISIHGSRIWVDEAQDFPWRAWLSLENVLKLDVEGHMLWVSGVPNGERQDNVLFRCDQEDDKYISYNIGQPMMSWWTPEIELERRRTYSAINNDTEDYKHYVLGLHGVPTYSVFDRAQFKREKYDVARLVLTQQMFETAKRIGPDGQPHYYLADILALPPTPARYGRKAQIGVGYDVGYSPDPAVFFVMYNDLESGGWKNLVRVVLTRVEYALQREVLLFLDTAYGNFDFMGIDMGGPGKVQYQDLTSELSDQRFQDRLFRDRIFPVEFGARMTVAVQDGEEGDIIEKKDNVKKVAVETVSRWVHEKRFIFSDDDYNLMEELERTKFTRTITGEPVYKTEDDHQFAAMMCAIMAYENKFGTALMNPRLELSPKLVTAKWLDTRVGAA